MIKFVGAHVARVNRYLHFDLLLFQVSMRECETRLKKAYFLKSP